MASRKSPGEKGLRHRVKDGEWVGSIAISYGFTDWEGAVWGHAENRELRDRHEDPHVLAEGDELFIPPRRQKQEQGGTGRKHVFRLKVPTEEFHMRILGPDQKPLAGKRYELALECGPGGGTFQQKNRSTDSEGMVVEVIPSTTVRGKLRLPELKLEFDLNFGRLTPLDLKDKAMLIRGAQERLDAVGFDPGPIDGLDGPRTRAAVRAFQQFCKDNAGGGDPSVIDSGPVDGIVGPKTRAALISYYGS